MYELYIFLGLTSLGYIAGSIIEKNHYKSIRKREAALLHLPAIALKKPLSDDGIEHVKLITGNVVISIDYFKKILAGLINFFGGNISAYETLIDRARREAVLRMKESAKGASEIINIRIETTSISKNTQSVGAIEVIAYGTAIYR
jgi:uncharacterized protein YbjQ (UPF0145 family)